MVWIVDSACVQQWRFVWKTQAAKNSKVIVGWRCTQ